jgi:hypothetical protein
MGFFEAAVVVYLRRLWEAGLIDVTAISLSDPIALTELLREVASLAMIASVAFLAGRRGIERLAHAAIVFGTWDILYYVFLRLLIGWPATLLDWDVLFLIPRPWVAPVLAPVLVSCALVACGLLAAVREGSRPLSPGGAAWALSLAGGAVVIASFLAPSVPRSVSDVPSGFSWPLFLAGLAVALAGFVHALVRPRPAPGRGAQEGP